MRCGSQHVEGGAGEGEGLTADPEGALGGVSVSLWGSFVVSSRPQGSVSLCVFVLQIPHHSISALQAMSGQEVGCEVVEKDTVMAVASFLCFVSCRTRGHNTPLGIQE
jgi:hypothetical protein